MARELKYIDSNPEQSKRLQDRTRQRLVDGTRELWADNASADPATVEAEVTAAVEAVRQRRSEQS